MEKMRLDKYMATFTSLSRKEAKAEIRKGNVEIDGVVCKKEDEKVSGDQSVFWQGTSVNGEKYEYYMLHKPAGYLSATKDVSEKTVLDLMPDTPHELFPVGRLDKDTEGLLILTDDGALAHRLLSPKYHVDKVYYVEYEGKLLEDAEVRMQEGMDIGERKLTKPAKLELLEEGKALLTIREGKFHQVKRMIAGVGGKVSYLKRVEMAGIVLPDTLLKGEWRLLTKEEIEKLYQMAGEEK